MDIQKLRLTHPKLLQYQIDNNFGKVAKQALKTILKRLFEHEGEYSSYEDFFVKFIDPEGLNGGSKRLCYYRAAVRTVWAFDEFDHYPNRLKFAPTSVTDSSYCKLIDSFRNEVDELVRKNTVARLSKKTIAVEKNMLSCFLFDMQNHGADSMAAITMERILSHFYDGKTSTRTYAYTAKLKSALNHLSTSEAKRISTDLPHIRRIYKNVSVIPEYKAQALRKVLNENDNRFSLRDKAILGV